MSKRIYYIYLMVLIMLMPGILVYGQTTAQDGAPHLASGIREIVAAVDSFNRKMPEEKLFLHLDKPYYAVGDTIWFKAYLFQASTHAYSPMSGLLYVELINDSSKQVRRISVPVSYGLSWGQFALDPGAYGPGSYTIRAYTRWMENFGEGVYFHQRVFVAPATSRELTARSGPAGRRRHQGMQVNSGGNVGNGSGGGGMPPEEKLDLQLMPEGGWLVAGLPSRVGFKAIGEDGLGRDIVGTVVDGKGNTILTFKSGFRGMGSFELKPEAGESYTAIVQLPGGASERRPMPQVRRSGYVMRVDNAQGSDSFRVTVLATPDLIGGNGIHLIGLSRGLVCYAANMHLNTMQTVGTIPKGAFPSGIAHLTLFHGGEPVCERLAYVDHGDDLKITVGLDKDIYAPRDSVALTVKVRNAQGEPVPGSFSLAVTDDGQVRSDANADNIVSRVLLTSGLKGYIETPSWYFANLAGDGWKALDDLLLTQGWTGYQWKEILKPKVEPAFAAEPGFQISGKVTNLVGGGVQEARVVLVSTGRTELTMDTVAGPDGRFVFNRFPRMDSTGFVLQVRNAKGKSFGVGVVMDEFKAPAINPAYTWGPAGPAIWGDAAGDSVLMNYVADNEAMLDARDPYGARYKTLQKVVVRATPVVRGSHNLNGAGQADQVVDEATIQKAGKITLKELLQQQVKGFRISYSNAGIEQYFMNNNPLRIVIDGVNLSRFGVGQERETLDYLTAEDLIGIEVMYRPRNTVNYGLRFSAAGKGMAAGKETAFIEVTTRSGNGIFMKRSPGVTTFAPMPLSWPVAFYTPRYPVRGDAGAGGQNGKNIRDLRSTIHWQPSLVTDKTGSATTSFYCADTPGSYTIIVQGSDMDGDAGFSVSTIKVSR